MRGLVGRLDAAVEAQLRPLHPGGSRAAAGVRKRKWVFMLQSPTV